MATPYNQTANQIGDYNLRHELERAGSKAIATQTTKTTTMNKPVAAPNNNTTTSPFHPKVIDNFSYSHNRQIYQAPGSGTNKLIPCNIKYVLNSVGDSWIPFVNDTTRYKYGEVTVDSIGSGYDRIGTAATIGIKTLPDYKTFARESATGTPNTWSAKWLYFEPPITGVYHLDCSVDIKIWPEQASGYFNYNPGIFAGMLVCVRTPIAELSLPTFYSPLSKTASVIPISGFSEHTDCYYILDKRGMFKENLNLFWYLWGNLTTFADYSSDPPTNSFSNLALYTPTMHLGGSYPIRFDTGYAYSFWYKIICDCWYLDSYSTWHRSTTCNPLLYSVRYEHISENIGLEYMGPNYTESNYPNNLNFKRDLYNF